MFLTVFMIRRSWAFCPEESTGFFVNFFLAMNHSLAQLDKNPNEFLAVQFAHANFHCRAVREPHRFSLVGLR